MTTTPTSSPAPLPQATPLAPALVPLPPNNFDFLRFLLAVMVILSHSCVLIDGFDRGYAREPLHQFTLGQTSFGDVAVNGFFAISGFLILHSYLRSRSLLDYLKKRFLRIHPAFIVANIICFFVVVPLVTHFPGDVYSPANLLYTLRRGILLRPVEFDSAFATNPYTIPDYLDPAHRFSVINGSMWTIPYEFRCYFILGLLGLAGLLRRQLAAILLPALYVLTFLILAGKHLTNTHILWGHWMDRIFLRAEDWPPFLTYFFAGATFYQFRHRIPISHTAAACSTAALLVATQIPHALVLLMPILGVYLLFYLAFCPLPLHRFAKYGDFSYGIYLYAFPIQQTLIYFFYPLLSPWTLFALATPLTILAGALSWHLLEKHFLRLKKRQLRIA